MPGKVASRSYAATSQGMQVTQEGVDVVGKMKLANTPKYVIFKADNYQLVVDEIANEDKTFGDFVAKFKEIESRKECRQAIFNVEFDHEGRNIRQLALFSWLPDAAPLADKSPYLGSVDVMKTQFSDILFSYRCTKEADFDFSAIKKDIIGKS